VWHSVVQSLEYLGNNQFARLSAEGPAIRGCQHALFHLDIDKLLCALLVTDSLEGYPTDRAFSRWHWKREKQETARTGVVPGYYLPFNSTTQPLFVMYTILTFSALAVYGGAVLSTRVLPHWVGWLAIVYGLLGLVSAGFVGGNVPPLVHYLLPMVMGILLLLQQSQLPIGNHHEEASTAASPAPVAGGKQ